MGLYCKLGAILVLEMELPGFGACAIVEKSRVMSAYKSSYVQVRAQHYL